MIILQYYIYSEIESYIQVNKTRLEKARLEIRALEIAKCV